MDKGKTLLKKYIAAILILILSLPAAVSTGALLMGISYMLPVKGIEEGMPDAAAVMEREGIRPKIFGSTTDNYTDSLILMEAAYDGRDSKKASSMSVPNGTISGREPYDSLIEHYSKGVAFDSVYEYPRYWHGTIPMLKLLLQFLSYKGMRILNAFFIVLTSLLIMYLLYRRSYMEMILPYGALIIASNPFSLYKSLQLSPCFYLMQLGIIFIIWNNEDEVKDRIRVYLSFLLVGILTAYTDLLTYPLVPMGIMLIFTSVRNYRVRNDRARIGRVKNGESDNADGLYNADESIWKVILRQVADVVLWTAGYGGMWVSKWILATRFLDRDVVADAKEMFLKRTGDYDYFDEKTITAFDSVAFNIKSFFENKMVYVAAGLFAIGLVILLMIMNRRQECKTIREAEDDKSARYKTNRLYVFISVAVCAVMPFVWYIVVLNHSGTHYWMTNRDLLITLFAVCVIIVLFTKSIVYKYQAERRNSV